MIQVMKYIIDQYLKPNMDINNVHIIVFVFLQRRHNHYNMIIIDKIAYL